MGVQFPAKSSESYRKWNQSGAALRRSLKYKIMKNFYLFTVVCQSMVEHSAYPALSQVRALLGEYKPVNSSVYGLFA